MCSHPFRVYETLATLSPVKSGLTTVLAVVVLLAAYGVVEWASVPSQVPGEGLPAFGHVFVVVGENTEATELSASNAPYLFDSVRPQAAWFTDYHAVTHHSLANYVAMTSGQFTPCEQADGDPAACHQDVGNLFSQLDARGLSWQVWEESMPAPCSLADSGNRSDLNPYEVAHNPAVYYDAIEGSGGVWSATSVSAECATRVLPTGSTGPNNLTALNAALALGDVGRFNLIVPNECEDGHSPCPPVLNRFAQFDTFLSGEIPRILASPAFGSDGVLIITYDEGTTGHFNLDDRSARGGHVVFTVLSPLAQRGSFGGTYDHYGLLRMLEDGFRLPSYLGNAARATPITAIWRS